MKRTSLPLRTAPLRTAPMRRTGRLRPRSAKTARVYVQRRVLVAALMAEYPVCQVPGCHRPSTDPHEPLTRARGGSIVDPINVVVICRRHHGEIHGEPAWAYTLGFLAHSWDVAEAAS